MATASAFMAELCETMRSEFGAGDEFELELGELISKYRRQFHRRQQCLEAARLLPHGAEAIAERQGCHRSTGYRRARRAIVAMLSQRATEK
jgi:hypothetical protein